MITSYQEFLAKKATVDKPTGIDEPVGIGAHLFEYQRDLVTWALRRGRAALFADTGLGKTAMQLEWAKHVVAHTGGRVLILAPLAVAAQTSREGEKFGIEVKRIMLTDEIGDARIVVANYDRLHLIDASQFSGVVLDESSILKNFNGSTRNAIIDAFANTPFKLACSATPAPNDNVELGNHAEFLGVMSRVEMLAQWFVHDGGSTQDWRLKGHAVDSFWMWVCSWAALVRKPSDIGHDDSRFMLPPLNIEEHVVATDHTTAREAGMLFVDEARTLSEQRAARRASMGARVARAAEIIGQSPNESWLVWCELNDEADAITSAVTGAVQIAGSDKPEAKEQSMAQFSGGVIRVLVTKPSIAGYGMNWQHCARIVFIGVSHSFEQFYQSVRRCWRFGQSQAVTAHIVTSDVEGAVVANLKRKEAEFNRMADEMVQAMGDITKANIRAAKRETNQYSAGSKMTIPAWMRSEA